MALHVMKQVNLLLCAIVAFGLLVMLLGDNTTYEQYSRALVLTSPGLLLQIIFEAIYRVLKAAS